VGYGSCGCFASVGRGQRGDGGGDVHWYQPGRQRVRHGAEQDDHPRHRRHLQFQSHRRGTPLCCCLDRQPDNYFIGICIEFNEAISAAPAVATQTWTLKTLDKAPVTANESLPDGMGAIKADHIRLLLGQVMPNFELAPTLDNKTALALQIAIWEIVHETDPSGVYDPRESQEATRGTAYFYSPSPAYAVSMAYEWLKNINDGTWGADAARAENIFALTLDGVQDYIVQIVPPQVVPLPAAAWLLGSGLLGLFAVARRKKNAG
jgi:hypothetical protein